MRRGDKSERRLKLVGRGEDPAFRYETRHHLGDFADRSALQLFNDAVAHPREGEWRRPAK